MAVDGAGDVFIADSGNNRVVEIPAGGGTQITVGTGLAHPLGVAVDGAGNVFVADDYNYRVVEVQRSQPPTFNFVTTLVGNTSTDSPQSVTVQNIGNQPLVAVSPGLSIGSNSFEQAAGSGTPADCTSSFSLAPGAACNLSISFIPQTSGSIASAATVTDNALNATAASQSVALNGTGQLLNQTISFTQSAPATAYYGSTFPVAAQSTSGLTVALSVDASSTGVCSLGAPTTLSGVTSATVTMLSAPGTCMIDANESGNGSYSAAAQQQTSATAALPVVLSSILVAPANGSVALGNTQQFTATGMYSDGSMQNLTGAVTWSSTSTGVATINAAGLASSVSQGSTTIEAALGSINNSTLLTIAPPALVSIGISSVPPYGPQGRSGQGFAYDSVRRKVVLFGGQDVNGNFLNDVWEWDGAAKTWTNVTPTSGPVPLPRSSFGMAYDPNRQKVVIYGGNVSTAYSNVGIAGDTWEWDGATQTWTLATGATSIVSVGLWASQMAYDPNLKQVILFGGQPYWDYPQNGGTYAWDGTTWNLITTSGPSGRIYPAMTTDLGRSKVVLFGGNSGFGNYISLGDTWEWDGTAWTQVAVNATSPSPRYGTGLAYDASRQVNVLFGGTNNPLDTWEWNGTNWTLRSASGSPSTDWSMMAFDSGNSKLVIFGQVQNSGQQGNLYLAGLDTNGVLDYSLTMAGNTVLALGQSVPTKAIGTYSDGTTQDVTGTVAWTSAASAIAGVGSSGVVTGAGQGNTTITATDGSINGTIFVTVTPPVLSSILVTPANGSVTLGNTQQFSATGTYSDSSTQDLTSAATWSSSNTGVATINTAGLAASVTAGSTTINACEGVICGSAVLAVNQSPAITSANSATFVVGTAGSFTVTGSGFPAPTFAESGTLPSGVSINPTTGILSGTPTAGAGGTYSLQITASNVAGASAPQSFTMTVNQAPAINSAAGATFTVGTAGSFTVTGSGFPVPTYSETGVLPNGVTFNTTTASLRGTPAAGTGGLYNISISASNGIGSNAVQNFTLIVNQAPSISAPANATFTVGETESLYVTIAGYPAPGVGWGGAFPAGVIFNAATGELGGTPAVGSSGTYSLTFTASNGVGSNAVQTITLTVVNPPAPTLTSVTPNSGLRGAVVPVILTGTNFTTIGTTVTASGTGVTVSGVTVLNSTSIAATFTISTTAGLTARNVKVASLGGTSNIQTFTVLGPSLAWISPINGERGTTVAVTLEGSGLTGTTAINVSGGGVTASGIAVLRDTTVTANFAITATAGLTARTVSVTTPIGTSSTVPYTIVAPPLPTLGSVTPNAGLRGTAVPVTLTGSNFTTTGTTVAVSGTGVTVGAITVVNSTTITTTLTSSATAAIGARNVTVTTPGGTSGAVTFTIQGPTISSIAPINGARGTTVPITLTGSGLTGATAITVSGGGVTASGTTVVSDTTVTANFTITATAGLTARTVSVTAPGGTSNTVTFTVVTPPVPTLTSVAPATGVRGTAVPVTLTGSNFTATGTTVAVSGTGVTVGAITVVNSTTITTTFTFSATAAMGARNVTVTTPGGTSGAVTFTVQGPTLASISPATGTHGTTVPVTLTGTNLTGATAVTISGTGVSCTGITSTSTTISASCAITAGAAHSARNVTATTPIGTTNALTGAFTVN